MTLMGLFSSGNNNDLIINYEKRIALYEEMVQIYEEGMDKAEKDIEAYKELFSIVVNTVSACVTKVELIDTNNEAAYEIETLKNLVDELKKIK